MKSTPESAEGRRRRFPKKWHRSGSAIRSSASPICRRSQRWQILILKSKKRRRKRDRHIDPSIIRGRFCQRTGKNARRRENYGFCSGKCQRDEGIGTGTKICKTQIKRSPHTKREITKQSVVSLRAASQSPCLHENLTTAAKTKKCRSSALRRKGWECK